MASSRGRLQIYRNANTGNYKFTVFRQYATEAANLEKDITSDGVTYKRVFVTGIPDGVSQDTNVALVERDVARRLTISFSEPITDRELRTIEDMYKTVPYRIPSFGTPVDAIDGQPDVNFIVPMPMDEPQPSTLSRYVEYRYFESRHQPATVLFTPANGFLYRFVPPRANVVILMPENFTRTDVSSGFFVVDENLIVRIYSRRPLSAAATAVDHNSYSEISIYNEKTRNLCKRILTNLGLHRITYQSDGQIYGSDSLITAVIGSTANINLPKYV